VSLLDLSEVTHSLMDLIRENVTQHFDPGLAGTLEVTAESPESVNGGATNRLTVYLYHVSEDPAYRNLPGPGEDANNVACAPLALSCFYILTAHHRTEDPRLDALTQQRLLGYSLKTMHDFPIVDDTTFIGAAQILRPQLRGQNNRLQIILRPVTPEGALAYWAGEDQSVTKLSAYYEVRVALMRPEESARSSPPVIRIGAYPLVAVGPRLERSSSAVRFRIPRVAGGTEESYRVTPGQVSHSTAGPPDAPDDRVRLEGVRLRGRRQSVLLRSAGWPRPVEVLDPAWNVAFKDESVSFDVQPTILHQGVMLDVRPGTYGARVRVVLDERVELGHLIPLAALTNEVTFTVGARVTSHDPPDMLQQIRVKFEPAFDLTTAPFAEGIELEVDGVSYVRRPAIDALGTFEVEPHALLFQPRFPTASPGTYPLRVILNGAEAQPFWIEIP
jgi:hypothetical protein